MISTSKAISNLKIIPLLATAILVLFTVSQASARAWTTDQLSRQLQTQAADNYSSVLVFMNGQVDVERIRNNHRLAKFTRQASHQLMVEELRQFAKRNQNEMRSYLDQGVASGSVKSYESYWIASAFQVEAKPTFIRKLIERADVAAVIEDEPLEALYNPYQQSNQSAPASLQSAALPNNLKAIGADSMWSLGYTGQGRLVCTFDTGVEGDHPALAGSWRGLTHSSAESWFDPVYQENEPHRSFDNSIKFDVRIHGTNTLGVIVGKDDESGDTTGVAFGAQWISAMVIDIPGANYLEAFQWAADPDGNPSTIADVPDVINHSWGFRQSIISCLDIFWIPIDNLEALGCVNVFACGNEGTEGTGEYTIRNPANRATTPTNTFSVGATRKDGLTIWPGSSRGPSDCDSVSIKPEVVAPGDTIFTTSVHNVTQQPIYQYKTGTSFAAPHVAGAVALLRQVNPNATPDEIKYALMNSATDMGVPGEDNTYGNGLINIPAAMALLPPIDEVNIFVQSLEHDVIVPGDTVDFVVNLKNSGLGTIGVSGWLMNPGPGVEIIANSAAFGNMPMNGTADNSNFPFSIAIADDFPEGDFATVDLVIEDESNYQNTVTLFFRVGTLLVESKANIEADSVLFTITNYGVYGLTSPLADGGLGFIYKGTNENNLYQCALLIGTAEDTVSDGVSNLIYSIDHDFTVAPEGNIVSYNNGSVGDHETFSRFDDSYSFKPVGVTVEQTTATYDGPENGNFVVLEYILINEGDTPINDLYAGMYFDWDFPAGTAGSEKVSFYRHPDDIDIGYMWQWSDYDYRGTAVLTEEGASTFWAIWNEDVIYDGTSEAEKYQFLTNGFSDTSNTNVGDQSYSIACGPIDLNPGQSDAIAFAIMAAADRDALFNAAVRAKGLYRQITPVVDDQDVALPREHVLKQNYPNPFNPVTRISFTLPKTTHATLSVHNSLGQRVAVLTDNMRSAGNHTVIWNGLNDDGKPVASGVYFYRLKTDEFVETRKMVLMK